MPRTLLYRADLLRAWAAAGGAGTGDAADQRRQALARVAGCRAVADDAQHLRLPGDGDQTGLAIQPPPQPEPTGQPQPVPQRLGLRLPMVLRCEPTVPDAAAPLPTGHTGPPLTLADCQPLQTRGGPPHSPLVNAARAWALR